jgi:hypothetical protein
MYMYIYVYMYTHHKYTHICTGWLFNDDGSASFTFLGEIEVIYHNPMKLGKYVYVHICISCKYVLLQCL